MGEGIFIRLTQPPGPDCCSIIQKFGLMERTADSERLQLRSISGSVSPGSV
ncbi:hypothetical protein D3C79_979780 [compost metagenome]